VRSRRGRPPSDPRPLLDAIFWKLAHHATWQDLSQQQLSPLPCGGGAGGEVPPMLTSSRYYRRLYRSGRLLTLYTALYRDFLAHSGTDLPTLVDQGCFTIAGNTVILASNLPETWQIRTARLFMQLSYQILRRLLRKTNPENRPTLPQSVGRIRDLAHTRFTPSPQSHLSPSFGTSGTSGSSGASGTSGSSGASGASGTFVPFDTFATSALPRYSLYEYWGSSP
jgi:uncharacterized membrane protein YgcG